MPPASRTMIMPAAKVPERHALLKIHTRAPRGGGAEVKLRGALAADIQRGDEELFDYIKGLIGKLRTVGGRAAADDRLRQRRILDVDGAAVEPCTLARERGELLVQIMGYTPTPPRSSPRLIYATDMQLCPKPRTKFIVPSMGSMMKRCSASVGSCCPFSSHKKCAPGNVPAQPLHEQLLYAPVVLRDDIHGCPGLALGKYPVRLHHQLRRFALCGGDMVKDIDIVFFRHSCPSCAPWCSDSG